MNLNYLMFQQSHLILSYRLFQQIHLFQQILNYHLNLMILSYH
jgi:hypothetical protein